MRQWIAVLMLAAMLVPEPSSQSPWDATLTLPRFTASPPAVAIENAAQLPHR